MAKFADLVKGLMVNGQAGYDAAREAFKVKDVDVDWGFVPKDVDDVARGISGLASLLLEKSINARAHAQKYLGAEGYTRKQLVDLLHRCVNRFALSVHAMLLPLYKCENPDCEGCKNMTGPDWKMRKDIAFVEMLISLSQAAEAQGIGEGIKSEIKRLQKEAFLSSGHAPEEIQ